MTCDPTPALFRQRESLWLTHNLAAQRTSHLRSEYPNPDARYFAIHKPCNYGTLFANKWVETTSLNKMTGVLLQLGDRLLY
ncbi:hypothetical protein T265_01258 [Opisthorchis viverrini]|uniref:Uncharacterized protein n=1 Tax=Opisthorchis viverrini TaxID=6198 RepID=A0A075AJ52_OPIVI|nr:hypothetical protein T265_01258 [Opisthorchis viverrini]KER32779.1 hypothetical protein T265_01258 [Opisthorchis viverrini]